MAEVTLDIGGRAHRVACRDGEEARLQMLGRMLEDRWTVASRAAGGLSVERGLLFVALMLADDLDEAERRPPADGRIDPGMLDGVAGRLEALADALERSAPNA